MMVEFLTSQMDYIYFVYGLGFFILAAIAYSLTRIRDQKMPWRWLCFFGLLHGANEWADMLTISLGEIPWLSFAKLIVLSSSFICLLEFGRRGASAVGRKRVPGWQARLLFFAPMLGLCADSPASAINVTVRYFIGFTGGIWACWSLYRYRRHLSARSREGMRLAIVAMGLYTLVAGLVVPKASFFPAIVLNQTAFLAATHLPIQIVRILCAAALSLGLWRHYTALNHAAVAVVVSRRTRRMEFGAIVAGLALLATGWYATCAMGERARQASYAQLRLVTELTAGIFMHERTSNLTGTPDDIGSPEYTRLKALLVKTAVGASIVDAAHMVTFRDGKLVMLLDVTFESRPDFLPPGSIMPPPSPALLRAINGIESSVECVPSDRGDAMICAYAPLKESGSYNPVGALVMLRQSGAVATAVLAERLPPILITTLVMAMLIMFMLVRQRDAERRMAQQVGESRLKEAQQLAHVGNWELDIPANRLVWSDELYRMCELQHFPGTPAPIFRDVVHPDDRARVETTMALSLKTDAPIEFTHRIRVQDAVEKTVLHSCHTFFDAKGVPVRMVGIIQDITERVRAEAALRENQRVLATLMSNLPGMAYRCCNDEQWTMTFVSEGCSALTGYSPDDLLGNTKVSYGDLIIEEHRGRVWDAVQVAVSARTQFTILYAIRDAHGNDKWVWEQGRGVYGENGSLLFLEGFITDTTERWKAEQALKRSRDFLQTVIDSFPDPTMVVGLDFRVQIANKALRALSNIDPVNDCLKCHQVAHGRDFPCGNTDTPCPLHLAVERKEAVVVQHTRSRTDGTTLHYEISAAPVFGENGTVTGIIESSRDITERVRAEDERRKFEVHLQQAQKLESLGILAGGIAHDFNNLLMAIMGNVDLALADIPQSSPASANLSEILSVTRRAADLCRQMLAYSGKGQFVVEPLNLNDVIVEIAHMMEVSISKKAELKYTLAATMPLVDADITQIHQILLNLIINASEAIGDKPGTITVATGSCTCSRDCLANAVLGEAAAEGTYVWVEVADTGAGMSAETAKRIFDPFFSTKFTGRGLGLATVLGIVRGHKGVINVSSTQGQGTVFRILIPVSKATEVRTLELPAHDENISGSGIILVVDDDERIRAIGHSMLQRLGYTPLLAANGCEAVAIYRTHQAQIIGVILDLAMPQMDGAETFRELHLINPNVRVIMSSGYDEQSVAQRFVGQGLAGFIQKPYRVSALGTVIKRFFR